MKISQVIERLKQLQEIAGDVPVGSWCEQHDGWEPAAFELQNVVYDERTEGWKADPKDNTEQIVAVF